VEEEDRYLQVVGAFLDAHDLDAHDAPSDRTRSRHRSKTA